MPDGSNVGVLISVGSIIGAVIGSVITWAGFWLLLSDRRTARSDRLVKIEKAIERNTEKIGEAIQDAAEAKNETVILRKAYEQMTLDFHDQLDQTRREVGESNAALRLKVHEVEMFMRDKFMLKEDFKDAMAEMKAIQSEAMKEIKDGQLRMDDKLDNIAKDIRDGHGRR